MDNILKESKSLLKFYQKTYLKKNTRRWKDKSSKKTHQNILFQSQIFFPTGQLKVDRVGGNNQTWQRFISTKNKRPPLANTQDRHNTLEEKEIFKAKPRNVKNCQQSFIYNTDDDLRIALIISFSSFFWNKESLYLQSIDISQHNYLWNDEPL